jgi:predicted MFS family arabinose efflux permease
MATGALIAMPLTGQILDRRSSAGVTRVAALLYLPLVSLVLNAPSPALLGLALLVFGAANGSMDVAMNAHGVAVERSLGKPIMSSLHAGWSFGGLAGSGGVALAVALDVDPRVEGAVASAVLWLMAVYITSRLGSASAHSEHGSSGFALPSRGVLLIGALCFLVMVTEGAMGDWSGIYLKNDLGASGSAAATGFAGFSLGMALARLAGDDLNRRWGAGRLLSGGMALVTVALGLVLVIGEPVVAVVGFALIGVGIANAVPLLFSAAGRVPPSGPSLAAVFTVGYTGFIVGPPLIGVLADAISLPAALGVLCAAGLAVTLLGGRAADAEEAGRRAAAAQPA